MRDLGVSFCCTCAYTFAPYYIFVSLFGAPWRHFGTPCRSLGTLGAPLGLKFGSPGVILASLGHHLCNLLSLLAVDRKSFEKGSKKLPKRIGFGSQAGRILMIFRVFVESCKQRLDCACAVGLGLEPLVFTLWASLCASMKNDSLFCGKWKSPAAEPAPS